MTWQGMSWRGCFFFQITTILDSKPQINAAVHMPLPPPPAEAVSLKRRYLMEKRDLWKSVAGRRGRMKLNYCEIVSTAALSGVVPPLLAKFRTSTPSLLHELTSFLLHNIAQWKRRHFVVVFYQHFEIFASVLRKSEIETTADNRLLWR